MSTATLARTAAALKLTLLRGSLRPGAGSATRRIGFVASAVGGALFGGISFAVLAGTRGSGTLGADLSIILFTGLLLGWIVLPVLTFGSDDLLDPRRLALLPLTSRQRVTVLGVGATIGIAPAASGIAALGLLPATGRGVFPVVIGLVAVLLQLALCITASRVAAALLAGVLGSRRGRDLGVALTVALALGIQVLNPVFYSVTGGEQSTAALHRLAEVLRWTPPGMLAAAPGYGPIAAVTALGFAGLLVVAAVVVWGWAVRRSLATVDASGTRERRTMPLAPRGVPLPGGRAGAIAAKDLRYLVREPKRSSSILIALLLPAFFVATQAAAGGWSRSPTLVFVICGTALLGALNSANRFGTDGSATWMVISTATDRRDAHRDLLGGDVAVAVVLVPLMVAVGAGIAAFADGWGLLAAAVGTALALLGVQLALSGWASVLAPAPVPDSAGAFGGGNAGQGCATAVYSVASLVAGVVVCLPLLALLIPAITRESPWWDVAVLVGGTAYGLGMGEVIRRRAALRWAARGPEVLAAVSGG